MALHHLIAQSSLGREDSSASLSILEEELLRVGADGWSSLSASLRAKKSVQEYLQASAVDGDEHLVNDLELSEALHSVAEALRRVAVSKAGAQEAAAEWKRKYEQERIRNICLQQQNYQGAPFLQANEIKNSSSAACDGDLLCHQESPSNLPQYATGQSFGRKDFCDQQFIHSNSILSNLASASAKKPPLEKASFRLEWGCNGEKSRRHKHEIVSFENGNITTANHSSKQITLIWDTAPQTVCILSKPNSASVQQLCMEMIRWLEEKQMGVIVEPRVRQELLDTSPYYSFVQTWESDSEVSVLHQKVDLIVTLGGDGTVLWAASLFKGPVPPVVSFSMGSLGFMTPFDSGCYQDCLQTIMNGPMYITLRHRLQCRIMQADESIEGREELDRHSEEIHLVLNEVTIDRGMSSYLTNLECYCDDVFVTSVQGDGLILSTPSGSTAYSLAAGGSMVHPQVPAILFTPICPHSLSFRPLILPECVTLKVKIPDSSRGPAWVSFDGKDRLQLGPGDGLICRMSSWPVPAACIEEPTHEFLRSVREGLHWNLRKTQSFEGPRDVS
ncbi:hypothetical protein O6H91_03G026700 [Diphasiastrum complanatum]|uniref:Uncharacterized protein n=1 Tax=Diphasiastrum complanatum TaxID=34168 RepID=A0ACC2E4P5_DIPCM|nr:hypothetical protein O6H91_03G026700 [Diphasiastrum complanatum]